MIKVLSWRPLKSSFGVLKFTDSLLPKHNPSADIIVDAQVPDE